ncbi:MAG: hypothetical protein V2A79_15765 [Planctomycetota bacterium]
MASAKRKDKPNPAKRDGGSSWEQRPGRAARILTVVQVCLTAGMSVGAAIGLAYLDAQVHAAPRFQQPPVIELADVPAGLRDTMAAKLAPFETTSHYDPDICAKIGRALETDPWVRRVKSVCRLHDLRIVVECAYRLPAALVQLDSGFYLVDQERVRLPGVYGYQDALPLIQGVGSDPPPPGTVWTAPDLAAGMALARLIASEPFARQVTGIQVHNYGGRRLPPDAHLVLTTDRAGCLIKWGSAPGEEVEENSSRQKIAILRHNFERFGRADAGFHVIDISVYPDRFTTAG